MLKEFKEFIMRGNVVDMAVGVIIHFFGRRSRVV
ncbi:MAG: large-conductance mechanosensitive channel [Hyphomicrobiaceae bacterium]|jgi:large-conductance mechanosensitive channel